MEDFLMDSISELFEPDTMLPCQFFPCDEVGLNGGERRLMAAILSDGIEAYLTFFIRTKGEISQEALSSNEVLQWVHTRDHSYVFSFDVVCESLGINAEYLRFGLGRYVESICLGNKCESVEEQSKWKKIRRPRK